MILESCVTIVSSLLSKGLGTVGASPRFSIRFYIQSHGSKLLHTNWGRAQLQRQLCPAHVLIGSSYSSGLGRQYIVSRRWPIGSSYSPEGLLPLLLGSRVQLASGTMRDRKISTFLSPNTGLDAGPGVTEMEVSCGTGHKYLAGHQSRPRSHATSQRVMHAKGSMSNLTLVKYVQAIRNTPRSVVCNRSLFASSLIFASSAIPMSKCHPTAVDAMSR